MTRTLSAALVVTALVYGCQSAGTPAADQPTPDPSQSSPAQQPAASQPATTPPPTAAASNVDPDEASTLDGIYTAAQAERGAAVFADVCSECHKIEEWSDAGFRARWSDESVYRFWYYIYEQMPNGSPPYSLTRTQVTDVLTYILQLNGLPTGPNELGTDDDSIDLYWLRWAPNL